MSAQVSLPLNAWQKYIILFGIEDKEDLAHVRLGLGDLNFAAEAEVGALANAVQNMNYLSSLNMLFDTATLYPKEDVSSSSSSLSLFLHRFCILSINVNLNF